MPDRTADTSATWMATHPELEMISRDRGGDYAAAARKSAPQATQTADRFHLYKNLTEAVELVLACCRAEIRKSAFNALSDEEKQAMEGVRLPTEFVSIENWKPIPDPCTERARLTDHAQRQDRYAQVMALREQGLGNVEIARRVGLTARTLQNWQKNGFALARRRQKRPSIFDPFAPYVLSRWRQGCRDIQLISSEIQQQGYHGSMRALYRFVHSLREHPQPWPALSLPSVLDRISVQKATWLIARPSEDLNPGECIDLQELCEACPALATLHLLAQSFGQIVRELEGYRLAEWMKQVKKSPFRNLKRLATGLHQDQEEILAGLRLVYSNGQVEGFVNKLKLIKRQGYGRASFSLLRQRMLHAL